MEKNQSNWSGSSSDPEICPKASKLGLGSARFARRSLSSKTESLVNSIKKKDKPDFELPAWSKNGLHKWVSFESMTAGCIDTMPRIDADKVSFEEFAQKYLAKNLPVAIRGVPETQNWDKSTLSFKVPHSKHFKTPQMSLSHFLPCLFWF